MKRMTELSHFSSFIAHDFKQIQEIFIDISKAFDPGKIFEFYSDLNHFNHFLMPFFLILHIPGLFLNRYS
jgi:hypothetical protein